MPKKPKLSKKEKKRLAAEKKRLEAEALQKEQERLLALKEQKRLERLEQARKLVEQKKKRRIDEARNLEMEKKLCMEMTVGREEELQTLRQEKKEQYEWRQHLACTELDVRDFRQINHFLSLWSRPELARKVGNRFLDTISSCHQGCALGRDLVRYMIHSSANAFDEAENEKYAQMITYYLTIGELTKQKIDDLTNSLLMQKNFQQVLDRTHERTEYCICRSTEELKYGLWISNMANSSFRSKKVEFTELGITIELPKELAMQSKKPLGVRFIWTKMDPYFCQNSASKYTAFGGVYSFEVIDLPAPCLQHEQFRLQVSDYTVQIYDYGQTCDDGAEKIMVKIQLPQEPIDINTQNIDNLEFVWWNGNSWEHDKHCLIEWDADDMSVNLTLTHLKPCSFALPKGCDSNYTNWKLEPRGVERCLLTLTASRFDIEIEITGSGCELKADDRHPPNLACLHNATAPMPANVLVQKLMQSGVNIWVDRSSTISNEVDATTKETKNLAADQKCHSNNLDFSPLPNDDLEIIEENGVDPKPPSTAENTNPSENLPQETDEPKPANEIPSDVFVEQIIHATDTCYSKDVDIEMKAYSEIASIGACFELTASRWNMRAPPNCFLFHLRKPLTIDEPKDSDEKEGDRFKLTMINENLCVLLKGKDEDEFLNLEIPDDEDHQHEAHILLRRCIDCFTGTSTSDITRNLNHTSLRFQENLRSLLSLVRPLHSTGI